MVNTDCQVNLESPWRQIFALFVEGIPEKYNQTCVCVHAEYTCLSLSLSPLPLCLPTLMDSSKPWLEINHAFWQSSRNGNCCSRAVGNNMHLPQSQSQNYLTRQQLWPASPLLLHSPEVPAKCQHWTRSTFMVNSKHGTFLSPCFRLLNPGL